MHILIRTIALVFMILTFQSCTKKTEKIDEAMTHDNDEAMTYHYKIYLTKDFRILKRQIWDDNELLNSVEYAYTDKTVQMMSSLETFTYFINSSGFADSAKVSRGYNVYYKYNEDGNLIRDSSVVGASSGVYTYEYENGNRVKENMKNHSPSYSSTFQYTSLPNYVDIDHFNGRYLGKLNRNLLLKAHIPSQPINTSRTTTFQYKLNADDLVIERTAVMVFQYGDTSKEINKFEYIFVP